MREEDITVVRVPGAFEIPVTALRAAETGQFDAVICIGCVIKGETMHFEYIAGTRLPGDRGCRLGDRRPDCPRRADDADRGAGRGTGGGRPRKQGTGSGAGRGRDGDAVPSASPGRGAREIGE